MHASGETRAGACVCVRRASCVVRWGGREVVPAAAAAGRGAPELRGD
jgi:hypothetical protein